MNPPLPVFIASGIVLDMANGSRRIDGGVSLDSHPDKARVLCETRQLRREGADTTETERVAEAALILIADRSR